MLKNNNNAIISLCIRHRKYNMVEREHLSVIHSVNKYLLSIYYVPRIVLGTRYIYSHIPHSQYFLVTDDFYFTCNNDIVFSYSMWWMVFGDGDWEGTCVFMALATEMTVMSFIWSFFLIYKDIHVFIYSC